MPSLSKRNSARTRISSCTTPTSSRSTRTSRTRRRWPLPAGASWPSDRMTISAHLSKPGTRQLDIGGKTIVPGFIDAHTHPSYAGIRHLRWVDCDLRSIAAIQDAIRAASRENSARRLGDRLQVRRHQDQRRPQVDPRGSRCGRSAPSGLHRTPRRPHGAMSTRSRTGGPRSTDADCRSRGRPVRSRPGTGRLTGGLRENATEPFRKILPTNFTRDEMRQGVKLISQMMVRTGVTSVHDAAGVSRRSAGLPGRARGR